MQVTDSVASLSGFISHLGGSVCPEHSSRNWDVTVMDKDTGEEEWIHDAGLEVTCVQPLEDSREAPRAGDRGHRAASGRLGDLGEEERRALRRSDGSAAIIGLAVLCLLMIAVFAAIFGTKFRRAWSQGAQGGQLIRESFRIN